MVTKIKNLTKKESRLYSLLKAYEGKIVDRQSIADLIWGGVVTRVIDVYIGYLRKKIGRRKIKTRVGFGYILKIA